ncbi:MAG: ThiF family adenylyltransferase [Eubacterium sp.]
MEQFSRTELLLGKDSTKILGQAVVAIFGVGGVGGYVAEALARSGIGRIDIIDNDTINESNINRQIIALYSTIGKYKADVMKDRILDINPNCIVNAYKIFLLPETSSQIDFSEYDYVIDAIDTVTGKIEIIKNCHEKGVPVISCMGAGNKLDPSCFIVTDIYKTHTCPLARVMRRELKKRNINSLKVVYSTENAKKPIYSDDMQKNGQKLPPGSLPYVPGAEGLIAAGEVIKDLLDI